VIKHFVNIPSKQKQYFVNI